MAKKTARICDVPREEDENRSRGLCRRSRFLKNRKTRDQFQNGTMKSARKGDVVEFISFRVLSTVKQILQGCSYFRESPEFRARVAEVPFRHPHGLGGHGPSWNPVERCGNPQLGEVRFARNRGGECAVCVVLDGCFVWGKSFADRGLYRMLSEGVAASILAAVEMRCRRIA